MLRYQDIVIATSNVGKLAEIQALLAPYPIRAIPLTALNISPAAEDGSSYKENAIAKAISAARASGMPAMSDDSGIEVEALGGQPGVLTARWTKQQGGDKAAVHALWRILYAKGGSSDLGAGASVFCALSIGWPDGRHLVAQGSLRGRMIWPPRVSTRGLYGMFVPDGQHLSLSEIMQAELEASSCVGPVSHRKLAFLELLNMGLAEHLASCQRPKPEDQS